MGLKTFEQFTQNNKHNEEDEQQGPQSSEDVIQQPHVEPISNTTQSNQNFREVIWTGEQMQLTVMSIAPNDDIGLELHDKEDQFLRIEQGQGVVKMGESKDNMDFEQEVSEGSAIFIPRNYWHNVENTGETEMKLYSIYAPPHHPTGTVHETKADDDD
jgi:mannose-6-phosphate isomerase-like protein (cupin superfamily)